MDRDGRHAVAASDPHVRPALSHHDAVTLQEYAQQRRLGHPILLSATSCVYVPRHLDDVSRNQESSPGTDGSWSIRDLPAGDYKLRIYDPSGARKMEWFDNVANPAGAQVFSMAASSQFTGLVTALEQFSVIGGVVTNGITPLPGMIVDAYAVNGELVTWTKNAATRADGSWSIRDLPSGDYKIRIYDPARTYTTEWHDNVPTSTGATVFTMAPGSEYKGLSAVLSLR